MTGSVSVAFFDEQFRKQSHDVALVLNPFEVLALPFLTGEVLDFGCGMGNLAFAAASQGCTVTALDASPAAIEHIHAHATATGLPVYAALADLRDYPLVATYDAIVSIGLLMFFDCARAINILADLKAHVRPGGVVVVNVLVEGTTYIDMFDPTDHCLFAPMALQDEFEGWTIERMEFSDFAAPNDTLKRFCTVVARNPA
ncbi:MAG TPA: class I SAM-dependent methyltransferase [Casimicrobium sp.]|nr:class I SAM-dependent methyltransferase [Casimicrobium sp.]